MRSDTLLASGEDQLAALTGGYHVAFLAWAIFAAGAAVFGAVLLRGSGAPATATHGEAGAEHEPFAEAASDAA